MSTYNQTYIKNKNRFDIFKYIFTIPDVNRQIIAEKTGLTNAAVTKIINNMINDKLIEETNYFSNIRKRKARYLKISSNVFGGLILHISRNRLFSSIIDFNGTIIYSHSYGYSYTLLNSQLLINVLEDLFSNLPENMKCLGVVFVTPGIKVEESENKPPYYWNFKEVQDYLRLNKNLNLYHENDSNSALLGELWFGNAKNDSNVVLYNIGMGIGASAFKNDNILTGYNGSSIEIGHVSINYKGPKCSCGNRGCLEYYTNLKMWEKKIEAKFNFDDENKIEKLFYEATEKNLEAIEEINEYSSILSEGALILANVFSPSKIIITTNDADYFNLDIIIEQIQETITNRLFSIKQRSSIEICPSALREKGYLLGGLAELFYNIL